MMDRGATITEADLQRILQAMRRGGRPLTLDEMAELLRAG